MKNVQADEGVWQRWKGKECAQVNYSQLEFLTSDTKAMVARRLFLASDSPGGDGFSS